MEGRPLEMEPMAPHQHSVLIQPRAEPRAAPAAAAEPGLDAHLILPAAVVEAAAEINKTTEALAECLHLAATAPEETTLQGPAVLPSQTLALAEALAEPALEFKLGLGEGLAVTAKAQFQTLAQHTLIPLDREERAAPPEPLEELAELVVRA